MSNHDQNFFDMFMLVLGVLIGTTFAIFLLARFTADETQEQWILEDASYQQQVVERIRPFGQVALPGDEAAQAPAVADTTESTPVTATMSGPQVYNAACLACHGAGIGGAPKIGDQAAWEPRLAQDMDTIQDHVLNGYTGEAGYMPPKGGRTDLSDEEILAALDYMLDEVR